MEFKRRWLRKYKTYKDKILTESPKNVHTIMMCKQYSSKKLVDSSEDMLITDVATEMGKELFKYMDVVFETEPESDMYTLRATLKVVGK